MGLWLAPRNPGVLGEENSLATMGPEQGSGARVFTAKEAGLEVPKMTSLLSPETPVAAVKLHGSQTRPKSSSSFLLVETYFEGTNR